jgi:hypothetical protein
MTFGTPDVPDRTSERKRGDGKGEWGRIDGRRSSASGSSFEAVFPKGVKL